jgi:hypothetical protein
VSVVSLVPELFVTFYLDIINSFTKYEMSFEIIRFIDKSSRPFNEGDLLRTGCLLLQKKTLFTNCAKV